MSNIPLKSTHSQYALVAKGPPVDLPLTTAPPVSTRRRPTCRRSAAARMVREERLLKIYESYAENFPNPRLIQEYQTRDQLLRAVSAADHAVSLLNRDSSPKEKRERGFFSRLIWGTEEEKSDDHLHVESNGPNEQEDDRLLYKEDESFAQEEDHLLQTTASLDVTCIPSEAHAMARLSLASAGRGHRPSPNVARTSWETACGNENGCVVLTGLGTWVEFSRNGESPPRQHVTTDREYLEHYFQRRQFDLARVRAATIGPNLMVVSWGGDDGYVVFYRRLKPAGWESVACLGATEDVRESLGDFLHTEGDQDHGSAELLVTDIVPLVVELHEQAPAAALAVSRLGGFVEFVPLPAQVWYGPEIPITKSTKRKYKSHYAAHLPDLSRRAGGIAIAAVTTADYHSDIIGLEAFRTSLDANDDSVEWDQDAYPSGPPAEHVLAAHGTKDGKEVITFWSVSTIIAEPESNHGIGFTMHATLLEACYLGIMGPEISMFASPKILRYWRRPRNVELRSDDSSASTSMAPRVTTLSVPAPIVSLRFAVVQKTAGEGKSLVVVCAALDWNGGISVLDCSLLERAAAQTLSVEELNNTNIRLVQESANNFVSSSPQFVTILKNRSESIGIETDCQGLTFTAPLAHDVQWLPTTASKNQGMRTLTLVSYVESPSELHFFALSWKSDELAPIHSMSRKAVTPFPEVSVATLHRLEKRSQSLFLVCQKEETSEHPSQLILCSLQEVNYVDVVQWYFRTSRLREAIHAAESLSLKEQKHLSEIIEQSKIRLWESEQDLSALEAIRDHGYLVREALYTSSDEQTGKLSIAHAPAIRHGSLALYRSVCRLALKRIKSSVNTYGATLSIASSVEEKLAIVNEIEKRLVKAATYELLCKYFCVEASIDSFLGDFLQASVLELSCSFARRGDVLPLSIIWFRHHSELLGQTTKVLDQLPLTLTPPMYQHFLPVIGSESFSKGNGCFLAGYDSCDVLGWSDMPNYLADRFDLDVLVDEEDKVFVLENVARQHERSMRNTGKDDVVRFCSSAVESWYCNRATQIQHFTPGFCNIFQFTRLALCALRVEPEDSDLPAASPEVQKLYRLKRNAESIISLLSPLDATISSLPSFEATNVDDFESFDSDKIVEMVLSCSVDDSDLLDRFKKCALPLLIHKFHGHGKFASEKEVDCALEAYCMHSVTNFEEIESQPHEAFLKSIRKCSFVVVSSKTSMNKSSRLIQDKTVLVNLVISLSEKVLEVANTIGLPPNQHHFVIDELWKMYEALPITMPKFSESEVKYLMEKSDNLCRDLVFLDIVSRWPGTNAISLLLDKIRILALQEPPPSSTYIVHGETVVAAICASFRSLVEAFDEKTTRREIEDASLLLRIMLQDIQELNEICFHGVIALKTALLRHFFTPLLHKKQIILLGEFLKQASPDLVESRSISGEVLSFVNAAVYGQSNDYDGFKINAAIACRDVLGKWLPDLHRDFEAIRSYLDATRYINEVLLKGVQETIVQDIQHLAPLEVIDLVLRNNPRALIIHCMQWQDQVWSEAANLALRSHDRKMRISDLDEHPPLELPPLPGHPIFHLARMLGFESDEQLVLVKALAVQHALNDQLYGAAAALLRTLLAENTIFIGNAAHIIEMAAMITSEDRYDDYATKDELCVMVLAHPCLQPPLTAIFAFGKILAFWGRIEHRNFLLTRDHVQNDIKSVHQLYLDTLKEYKINMDELFSALSTQFGDKLVDESLILTLAKYSFYWCVSRCTRPRTAPITPFFSESTEAVIQIAVALLLHVQFNGLSRQRLAELTSVFAEQKKAAWKAGSSCIGEDSLRPDPSIVNRLVGRGYSEAGARRAVVMTNHTGFEAALQWAVSHSLDVDFDNPIIEIKPALALYIDKEIVCAIERDIMTLHAIYSGSKTIKSAFSALGGETFEHVDFSCTSIFTENDKSVTAETRNVQSTLSSAIDAHARQTETISKSSSLGDAEKGELALQVEDASKSYMVSSGFVTTHQKKEDSMSSSSGGAVRAEEPLTSIQSKKTILALSKSSSQKLVNTATRVASSNSSDTSGQPASKDVTRTLKTNHSTKLKIPTKITPKYSSETSSESVKTLSRESAEPARSRKLHTESGDIAAANASSSRVSLDRPSLLEFGQAAFETARKVTTPSAEERQRLIEQGRMLLQKARLGESPSKSRGGHQTKSFPFQQSPSH